MTYGRENALDDLHDNVQNPYTVGSTIIFPVKYGGDSEAIEKAFKRLGVRYYKDQDQNYVISDIGKGTGRSP